jgi:hypothetical protein
LVLLGLFRPMMLHGNGPDRTIAASIFCLKFPNAFPSIPDYFLIFPYVPWDVQLLSAADLQTSQKKSIY